MTFNQLPCPCGPTSAPTSKSELRTVLRAKRRALPPAERAALSLAAQRHILESPAWRQARSVALYMAMQEETDTATLLEDAWSTGKTVSLPLCSATEKGHMDFFACSGLHELRPGPFGILEPDAGISVRNDAMDDATNTAGRRPIAPHTAPDLIIVPGVAFDCRGHRLGMGGGYYDRLFSRPGYAASVKIGLAFGFQLVPTLPDGDWDLPVDACGTEKGLIWIERP